MEDLGGLRKQLEVSHELYQRASYKFHILLKIGRVLGNVTDWTELEQGCQIILTEVDQRQESKVAIWRYHEVTQELELMIPTPDKGVPSFKKLKLNGNTNGHTARERQNIVVNNFDSLPEFVKEVVITNSEIRSAVVVPIQLKDHYFGNLSLSHPMPNYFSEADLELIDGVATQLAVAINRLVIEQRAREVEIISAIGEMSYSLTHRLGNDLGLVSTYVNYILKELEREGIDNAEITKYLDSIREDVRKTLDVSKKLQKELGNWKEQKQKKEYISILNLLEKTVKLHPNLPPGIEILIEIDTDVEFVYGVISQIEIILENLFMNAIQAMLEGGTVKLSARNVDHYVEIQVADAGIGVPAHQQESLFNFGYSTKSEGLGIGLWAARRYALAHGGDLTLVSTSGIGTAFSLWLPRIGATQAKGADTYSVRTAHMGSAKSNELRQAELETLINELRYRDEQRVKVLSLIGHEIRNPLSNLNILVRNLIQGIYGPLENNQYEKLNQAQNELGKALNLLEKLMTRHYLEMGKVNVSFSQINIEELIERVADSYRDEADEVNIEIITNCEPNTRLMADVALIQQVVGNLIQNAIKFNYPGGKVIITTSRLDNDVRVIVQDTGIGIEQEYWQDIFCWEYQVDSSLTRENGGIGYGLAAVRGYIDLHGGTIRVDSTLGKGSTFTVTLPIRER